jgi:hypothetical protein
MTTPDTDARPADWVDWGTPNGEHWYVIQAIADADGDGVYAKFVASSIRADVYRFERATELSRLREQLERRRRGLAFRRLREHPDLVHHES